METDQEQNKKKKDIFSIIHIKSPPMFRKQSHSKNCSSRGKQTNGRKEKEEYIHA